MIDNIFKILYNPIEDILKKWELTYLDEMFGYLIKKYLNFHYRANLQPPNKFDDIFKIFVSFINLSVEEYNKKVDSLEDEFHNKIEFDEFPKISPKTFDLVCQYINDDIIGFDWVNIQFWNTNYLQKIEEIDQTRKLRESIIKMLILVEFKKNLKKRIKLMKE